MHCHMLITALLGLSSTAVLALPGGTLRDGRLRKRYNHPPYPGKDTVRSWVALGDSFSAGPGAGAPAPGDEKECRRRTGAYAPQLAGSSVFGPGAYNNPHLDFRSCTGNEVPQVQNEQVSYVNDKTDLVTLSIGGNDIQFVPILTACVMNRLGNCDGAIANARKILYAQTDFSRGWFNLIETIWRNSAWQGRGYPLDRKTLLYQTSYPPFFDSYTTQCNDVRFAPLVGAKLDQGLRDKLNLLGQELNAVLAGWIDQFNYVYSSYNIGSVPPANTPWFMKFSNQDEFYNGHRFCRQDVREPDRNNPNTWFFNLLSNADGVQSEDTTVSSADFAKTWKVDPAKCDSTKAGQGEFADNLPCLIAQGIANGSTNDPTLWPAQTEAIQKTFHPRTPGFGATSNSIQYDLLYEPSGQPGSDITGKKLRIMGIGDMLAAGISDLNYAAGYRETLYQLLTSDDTNQVEFVGTQHQGPTPYNSMEGYLTGGVTDFVTKLKDNQAIQKLKPNIIILTAGMSDIKNIDANDYNGLLTLRTNFNKLVDYIFEACPNCAVLVGDIPPPPNPFQWPAADNRRQHFQFNAMISEVVNQQQTQNDRHITKLHFSVPSLETQDTSNNPTRRGYQYMAYDIVEKLALVDYRGWIVDPGANVANSGPTRAPKPLTLTAAPGVPTIGATVPGSSTGSTTSTSSSSSAAACSGNQIQGSCTQAHLPSATPNSGPQPPVCNKVDGKQYLMFNDKKTQDGVATYCQNLISGKVVLSKDSSAPRPGFIAGAAQNGGYVALTVLFDVNSCDPNTAPDKQKLDFGSWSQNQCYQYLYYALGQTCAKDSTWGDFDKNNPLEGGVYTASCAMWSMAGLPGSPPGNG